MDKNEKIRNFNPNSAGLRDSDIYGLPFSIEESDIVLIPVPWEVTVSYGSGAAEGPAHILESSFQVDLFHPEFTDLWKRGISLDDIPENLLIRSTEWREKAEDLIDMIEDGTDIATDVAASAMQSAINAACADMNHHVRERAAHWMKKGKLTGLVGGDHSTPLGYYRALAEQHESFGILHIDAHMDLRIAYEGFTYSHASIMYNALSIPQISKIVQVGIRDYCEEEERIAHESNGRVEVFYERNNRRSQFEGTTWHQICERITDSLPEKVHISFDIDGLDPTLCPNTGTPVPGGLSFEEACYLLSMAAKKRRIIGFDLVEVAPGE
jgi:agmatinase